MSDTALMVDGGATPTGNPSPETGGAGVASVHVLGWANMAARCSCGWAGRRRLIKAAAEQDAWAHAVRDRCEVSSPLVLAW